MADRKITNLPLATGPLQSDVVPIVSSSVTSQLGIASLVSTGLRHASSSLLGGVRIGSGLSISVSGTISVDAISVTDLDGISIQNGQNGDVLIYNSQTTKWENKNSLDGGSF